MINTILRPRFQINGSSLKRSVIVLFDYWFFKNISNFWGTQKHWKYAMFLNIEIGSIKSKLKFCL